ncbi:MAG: hypothetical protein IM551_11810, partial [Chitinophagaceae bacterium]|nr:hypothetical protein [Chitinophagaceae bacterium]
MFTISPATRKFINNWAGPILFGWMVYFILQQVREQPNLAAAKTMILQAFTPQHAVTWTIVLVLMLLNWTVEAY